MDAQSLRAYEKKATEAYENRDYAAALAYNQVLLEVDSQRVDALFKAGEAARHLRVFNLAEKYLEQIPDSVKTGLYSATDFRIASTKKGLGKYDEAARFYHRYIDTHTDSTDIFLQQANAELEYCVWAMERLQSPSRIEVVHLGENVNTVHSDFAPFRFADKLFFTSAHVVDTSMAPVERIYSAILEDSAIVIDENTEENNLHSSNITLTADGYRMYYTICRDQTLPNEYTCEIYYRDRNYEGEWSAPKKLPKSINLEGYTATQPAAGKDKFLKNDVLFFASDRPGGKGNLDIWCSYISKTGEFGDPFPLSFNTPQDDITPFFHQYSQTLFLSSAGLESMGGYDIYRSVKLDSVRWSEPENMGYPLNSSYDDLYYTFNSGAKRGYLASNRPGCLCAEPEKGCKCNDIFEAQIYVDLNAWTFNAVDSSILTGVKVELMDLATGKVDTFQVNPDGNKFFFPLDLEKNYRLTASLQGFQSATAEVSTEGINYFAVFERLLYLQPQIDLIARTYNAIDSLPLFGTALNLVDELTAKNTFHQNDEYSNGYLFHLEYGHHYRVEGTKPTYTSAQALAATYGINRPDTLYRDLYLSPFQGLPLVLYFDNDKPRYINHQDTTTTLTYQQTYEAFIKRKNAFIKEYSKDAYGPSRDEARAEVSQFFENEVHANYEKLQLFCDLLVNYLAGGHRMEIIIEGYASPLAAAEYNKRLTGRRISSLINHFRQFKGLLPYLESGQLLISRNPRGEEQEHGGVSDDGNNRRQSVYSPAASRLRRVTILEIRPQESVSGKALSK
jgi:hypothetical protein